MKRIFRELHGIAGNLSAWDLVVILGFAMIVGGVAKYSIGGALIAAGAGLLIAGLIASRAEDEI